jgi:hypothetical protein
MDYIVSIGDLCFDCFDDADDAFNKFLSRLHEGYAFAYPEKKRNRLGLTHSTMVALYDLSPIRSLFSPNLNPSYFRVVRDGLIGRTFTAEYFISHRDFIAVKFDHRQCLLRRFAPRQPDEPYRDYAAHDTLFIPKAVA